MAAFLFSKEKAAAQVDSGSGKVAGILATGAPCPLMQEF